MPGEREHIELWRIEAFGGVELLRAHLVEFGFSPHAHEEFMVVVSESGRGGPNFRGGAQRIGPGDVFVLNPGEVHAGGPARDSSWRYRSFYPPAALMQRVAREIAGNDSAVPHFAGDIVNNPQLAAKLRQAHRALEEPESALWHESWFLEALAILVTRHEPGRLLVHRIGSEHQAVRRVKDYLDALPGENVSLETLAREVSLSPFHLCRVFHQETGLSPHAYQIMVRVRLAKALLAGGAPISQAAMDAGFFDQAHLTKHFKRVFGVTPGKYLYRGTPSTL